MNLQIAIPSLWGLLESFLVAHTLMLTTCFLPYVSQQSVKVLETPHVKMRQLFSPNVIIPYTELVICILPYDQ